ncbi:MAG: hypothetical protein ACHBN1_12960 [Heteroscytonema crispum UTEX LB 1556]
MSVIVSKQTNNNQQRDRASPVLGGKPSPVRASPTTNNAIALHQSPGSGNPTFERPNTHQPTTN